MAYGFIKALIIVAGGKGGIGKSFTSQIVYQWLLGPDGNRSVRVIDSDVANSCMAQVFADAKFAALHDANDAIEASGVIGSAVRDIGERMIHGAVWDTAAGTEEIIRAQAMPALLKRAAKANVPIVCLRPITTSQYTQDAALEFAEWAHPHGVAVVFVRNLGQGRAQRYFGEWEALPERKAAIPPAVELVMPDLGCWIADEASSLRLSLGDIALGNFSQLQDKARAVAEKKFTPEIQLAVADWLELRCIEFEQAITQAIANLSMVAAKSKV